MTTGGGAESVLFLADITGSHTSHIVIGEMIADVGERGGNWEDTTQPSSLLSH